MPAQESEDGCEESFGVIVCEALNSRSLSNLMTLVATDQGLLEKHYDKSAPIRHPVVHEAFCAILEPLDMLTFDLGIATAPVDRSGSRRGALQRKSSRSM